MSLRSKEPSTQVYFVRHGKTDFPDNRFYCDDREDPSLSAEGRRQADTMARYFSDIPIARLIASPAARTWETATAVSASCGAALEPAPWLVERRYGLWEGLYFDEVMSRFPEGYRAWKTAPVAYTPEGAEGVPDLLARLRGGLLGLIEAHRGANVVVVTHVGPIRALIADAFGVPVEQSRQLRVDYASITRIDFGVQRNNLIFLNHVAYKKL